MAKKLIKSKILKHECPDCGWFAWRGINLQNATCSQCGCEKPPIITEDEIIREITFPDAYTQEEYEEAKRITRDIIDGKPLEEIEGLDLAEANTHAYHEPRPHTRRMIMPGRRARMIATQQLRIVAGSRGASWPLADSEEPKEYY
jgi:hypothetical protein